MKIRLKRRVTAWSWGRVRLATREGNATWFLARSWVLFVATGRVETIHSEVVTEIDRLVERDPTLPHKI